jgi:hypothetical protein
MSHITTDVEKIQAAVSELAGDLLRRGSPSWACWR